MYSCRNIPLASSEEMFSSIIDSLAKNIQPLTCPEVAFLRYSEDLFRKWKPLNLPIFFFSTSEEIKNDFNRFCERFKLYEKYSTEELQVHSLAMLILNRVKFLDVDQIAQIETDKWNGNGFCLSRLQLDYLIGTLDTLHETVKKRTKST